jgi:hypothetical protein
LLSFALEWDQSWRVEEDHSSGIRGYLNMAIPID